MELVSVPRQGGGDESVERVRKLIARKRSERTRLEADIQDVRSELAGLAAERDRVLTPLDDEVHDYFARLFESRLGERDAALLNDYYMGLVNDGFLSYRAPEGQPERECNCAGCRARRGELGPESDGGEGWVKSARRSPNSQSLRQLYRELATRYHPDKASDEETRIANERLMGEINRAYENGDLDALTALSRELGFDVAGDEVLETLAVQYEQIKSQVRALRRSRLGGLVVEARRCRREKRPSPVEAAAKELELHAVQLRSLASLFRAQARGEMSRGELLDELLGVEELEDEIPILQAMITAITDRITQYAARGAAGFRRSKKERAAREGGKRTRVKR